MRLIFLGTGGYHPNERRQTACVLLPELGIVFDAGTGFFRVPSRMMSSELTIFLSHAHLDHICGLTYPLVELHTRKITKFTVYGTKPTLDAVKSHLFAEPIFPVPLPCEWRELSEEISVGSATITTCRLKHPGGSTGFKVICNGRSMAYVTDTTANDSYLDFLRGVDVLIHECNFPDHLAEWCEKTGHSHTSQVAELARKAQVKRLFLTHIDPQSPGDDPIGLATARAIFPNTHLAEDLLEIDWN